MRSTVRDQLTALIVVPLTGLLLSTGVFVWQDKNLEAATLATSQTHVVLRAYNDVLVSLLEAQTGTRGYVISRKRLFAERFRSASAPLELALHRMRKVGVGDAVQAKLIERAVTLARRSFLIDTRVVEHVDRGNVALARAAVEDGAGQRAMDDFRAAVTILNDLELTKRQVAIRELADSWQMTYALFAVGIAVGFGTTFALYVTISRNIFRRLVRVGRDARAISEGEKPGPLDRGNDEIAQLERSLRTMLELAQRRESSLERYKVLSDRARDIMYWTDVDDRIIDANAAALKAYGYTRDEMLSLQSAALYAPQALRTMPDKLALVRAHLAVLFETGSIRKNGERFPAEVAITSTRMDGASVNFFVVRDITERRNASAALTAAYESAVESSRLKSQFVATVSHEIRTPLNAVIGMNELLLGTTLTDEQREYAETVRDSGVALLGIINNVLDFSKIEAGRLDLETVEINVCDIVESAGAMLATEAQRKDISLMTFVPPGLSRTVLGDGTRLRQILVNLIGNAVKFTQYGGVVASVDLLKETTAALTLHFTVSDSGAGFDAATSATIFEPFRQADGSTTRKFGGTGLGLSIARRLVELMGGTLSVTSTPGVGSAFSFSVDFTRIEKDDAPRLGSLAGSRVLIVESDSSVRDILDRYLVAWGLVAGVAAGMAEALALLRESATAQNPYDSAIVAQRLGGRTGFDLAAHIRADSTIAATHLIMVTAYGGPKTGEAAIAAGFSCYLTKPIRQSQLYDCVAKARRAEQPVVGVAARHDEAPAPSDVVRYRPERILLVEDQPVNRRLALQQLKKLGFSAEAVGDGEEAVNAVSRERYDMILMDCLMPVMDGFAATRVIRRNEASTGRRVPIVAMTANARVEDRDECLATGMDDYLAKPVQMEQLRDMLAAWLPSHPPL